MEYEFESTVIEWRGPAPFLYAPVPADISADIKQMANELSYGWGVIPVTVVIGRTEFTTSLFPRHGVYLVPLKVAVRKPEGIELGDDVSISMRLAFAF